MGLGVAEKAIFFTKTIVFPKIRYKNVQHFDLERTLKPKFGTFNFLPLPVPNIFLVPLLSFFSAFQLSLNFAFHILSGHCKNLGVC